MTAPKYFRLALIGENESEVKKKGTKVFENHGFDFYNGLTNNQIFIDMIFEFIANKSLETTEQELINRGFAVVNTDGISEELLERIPCLSCNRFHEKSQGCFEKEDALKFLNRHLPLMTDSLAIFLKRK